MNIGESMSKVGSGTLRFGGVCTSKKFYNNKLYLLCNQIIERSSKEDQIIKMSNDWISTTTSKVLTKTSSLTRGRRGAICAYTRVERPRSA
jgi:hypothetical protein